MCSCYITCSGMAVRVELYSLEDKMKILKSKQRLRATNEYYDIYIEGYKTQAELLRWQDKRSQLLRNTDIVRTRCTRGDASSFFCTYKTYLYA